MSTYFTTFADLKNHAIDMCGSFAPGDADALTLSLLELAEKRGYSLRGGAGETDWTGFFDALSEADFYMLDGYMPPPPPSGCLEDALLERIHPLGEARRPDKLSKKKHEHSAER